MKFVTDKRFVQLLNQALAAHPEGAYLGPFVNDRDGYAWPHQHQEVQGIYRSVIQQVGKKYGIRH